MSNTFIDGESLASIRTKINATTTEVEDRVTNRRYASTQKSVDTADVVTIGAGEIGTFKVLPLVFDNLLLNGFTGITNGIKYTGLTTKLFEFHGVSSVGASVTNTVVHFRLAINGVTVAASESSVKLESISALNTIAGVILIQLNPDDEIKVYVEADKACTVSAYHTALTLVEV